VKSVAEDRPDGHHESAERHQLDDEPPLRAPRVGVVRSQLTERGPGEGETPFAAGPSFTVQAPPSM
jgi:hypothetical protein